MLTRSITGQPAPAGMRSRHRRATSGRQQNGQAVRNHDGAGDTALGRHTGIGLAAIGRGGVKLQCIDTVHLLQEHRMRITSLLQQGPIGVDADEVITHMVAEVQAVPGCCGHATAAGGENGLHIGRRGPIGN